MEFDHETRLRLDVMRTSFRLRMEVAQDDLGTEADDDQLDNWAEVEMSLGKDNMWNINAAFLRQQIKARKTFILSHDPATATGAFKDEVQFLTLTGLKFVKKGSVWRAIP